MNRSRIAGIVQGSAIAVALWCILFVFQLLPGFTADTWGVLLFLAVGAAVGATRFRLALIVLLGVAALAVVVVTQTSVSNRLAAGWIRSDPLPDSSLPAVVVLSGGLNPNNTINSEALDHLITGLEMVRGGKARTLVTTTIEERFPKGIVTSVPDQSRIILLGGSGTPWLRGSGGGSTRDEALGSAQLLIPQGIRRIAVVAAPMHTRRACAAFQAVGFEVTCVPARIRAAGGAEPGPWPADRLKVFGDWVYEVLATSKYRARGWLAPR